MVFCVHRGYASVQKNLQYTNKRKLVECFIPTSTNVEEDRTEDAKAHVLLSVGIDIKNRRSQEDNTSKHDDHEFG